MSAFIGIKKGADYINNMEEKADFESLCDTHIGENHMVGKYSPFKPVSNYVLKSFFSGVRLTK